MGISGLVWVGHTQVLVSGTLCGDMSEIGPTEQGAGSQTGSRASFSPVGLLFLHFFRALSGRLNTRLTSIPGEKRLGSQKGEEEWIPRWTLKSVQACWTWYHVSAVLSHRSQRQRVLSLRPVWAVYVLEFFDNTTYQ